MQTIYSIQPITEEPAVPGHKITYFSIDAGPIGMARSLEAKSWNDVKSFVSGVGARFFNQVRIDEWRFKSWEEQSFEDVAITLLDRRAVVAYVKIKVTPLTPTELLVEGT